MISTIDRVLDEVDASREEWPIEEREEFLAMLDERYSDDEQVQTFLEGATWP